MKRILAIDDDPINRMLMSVLLEPEFTCDVVNSVNHALENLKQNKYDLIITDINLPGEFNGIWLGSFIKNNGDYSKIPVIAITAHTLTYAENPEVASAFDIVLQKPLIKEKLIQDLNSLFQNPTPIEKLN
ncbi:MAG: response regulator [Bacteroidia bacterium]|nr:response regulator [Bacteroidia bacterium]